MILLSTVCGILFIGLLYVFVDLWKHKRHQYIQDTYIRRKELVQEAAELGLHWGCTKKSATIILRKTWYGSDITMTIQKAEKELVGAKATKYLVVREELTESTRKYKAIKEQLEDTLCLLYKKSTELATKEIALTKWTEAASTLQKRIDELAAGDRAVRDGWDCYDYYMKLQDQSNITGSNQLGKKSRRKKK